jgi:hypothetical protein
MFTLLIFEFELQFIFGVLISVVAAGSIPAYGDKRPDIVSQSDVRNVDGSSQWR